jgi:heparin/heparan-sulfate lyase
MGEMIARTGWTFGVDSPDAVVHMRIGNYFFGNHQRKDWGTFQIYYKGPLAICSGVYEGTNSSYGTDHWESYYHQTIAHNGLLIFDPSETMQKGAANDGGQYWPNNGSDHPRDMATLLDSSNGYKMGEVTAHEFGPDSMTPDYSYIAGDITAAYAPSKRDRVTRAMVTWNTGDAVYPVVFMVYDRVISTDASFKKTWLIHSIQEPQVQNKDITIIRDEVEYDNNGTYDGKLVSETLLPSDATLTKVGGAGREFWVESMQTNYATTKGGAAEPCAWRVEVSPGTPNTDDRFLHVMAVMDKAASPASAGVVVQSDSLTGARKLDHVVLFSRSGNILKSGSFSLTGTDSCSILICDLEPGAWSVTKDAQDLTTCNATTEGKCIYFQGAGGDYQLRFLHGQAGELVSATTSEKVALTCRPNPFNSSIRIIVKFPNSEIPNSPNLEVGIYDIRGKLLDRLGPFGDSWIPGFEDSYIWPAQDHPAGLYLVRVKLGDRTLTSRILKVE